VILDATGNKVNLKNSADQPDRLANSEIAGASIHL
jgi:hypothetical protein